MDETSIQTARETVADVLGCPTHDVQVITAIGSLPQWDSIAHISIVIAVEEKLGRQMTAEEIASFETVGCLAGLFDERPRGRQ